LAKSIRAPSAATCDGAWVRTEPRVPTGMNAGVATVVVAVRSVAARADEPAAIASTVKRTRQRRLDGMY
jgi:hypothetical protein